MLAPTNIHPSAVTAVAKVFFHDAPSHEMLSRLFQSGLELFFNVSRLDSFIITDFTVIPEHLDKPVLFDGTGVREQRIFNNAAKAFQPLKGFILDDLNINLRLFIDLKKCYPDLHFYLRLYQEEEALANAQLALDLGFDGLYFNIDETAVDWMLNILQEVRIKEEKELPDPDKEAIDKYRQEIDVLDFKILAAVKQRMKYVDKIARIKKKYGLKIYQPERFGVMMNDMEKEAMIDGLDSNLAVELLELLHIAAIKEQVQFWQ